MFHILNFWKIIISAKTAIIYSAIYGSASTNKNGHTATCKFAINIDEIIIPKL